MLGLSQGTSSVVSYDAAADWALASRGSAAALYLRSPYEMTSTPRNFCVNRA